MTGTLQPEIPDNTLSRILLSPRLFYGFVVLAAVLVILGYTLPADLFFLLNNMSQVAIGIACTATSVLLYLSRRQILFSIAAFAFGGWTLSNLFWYSYAAILGRNLMYPTVADAGFLGFFLFLAAAYRVSWPRHPAGTVREILVVLPLVLLPVIAVSSAGAGILIITGLYILFSVFLLHSTVHRVPEKCSMLLAGTVLYCITMIYFAVQETYWQLWPEIIRQHFAGPMVIASFALIQVGLIAWASSGGGLRRGDDRPDIDLVQDEEEQEQREGEDEPDQLE